MKAKKDTEESLLIKMADLCSRSEQCEADILRKLLLKGLGHSQAADIISRLRDERFIDDARYARAFANDKVRFSGWGRLKIRMALRQKRISSADIDAAIEAIEESDYQEALTRAAKSASASLNPEEYADRQKFCRRLLQKGFESDSVMKAMRLWREQQ